MYKLPLWSLLIVFFLVTFSWSLSIQNREKGKSKILIKNIKMAFNKRRMEKMRMLVFSTAIGMVGIGALGRGSIRLEIIQFQTMI